LREVEKKFVDEAENAEVIRDDIKSGSGVRDASKGPVNEGQEEEEQIQTISELFARVLRVSQGGKEDDALLQPSKLLGRIAQDLRHKVIKEAVWGHALATAAATLWMLDEHKRRETIRALDTYIQQTKPGEACDRILETMLLFALDAVHEESDFEQHNRGQDDRIRGQRGELEKRLDSFATVLECVTPHRSSSCSDVVERLVRRALEAVVALGPDLAAMAADVFFIVCSSQDFARFRHAMVAEGAAWIAALLRKLAGIGSNHRVNRPRELQTLVAHVVKDTASKCAFGRPMAAVVESIQSVARSEEMSREILLTVSRLSLTPFTLLISVAVGMNSIQRVSPLPARIAKEFTEEELVRGSVLASFLARGDELLGPSLGDRLRDAGTATTAPLVGFRDSLAQMAWRLYEDPKLKAVEAEKLAIDVAESEAEIGDSWRSYPDGYIQLCGAVRLLKTLIAVDEAEWRAAGADRGAPRIATAIRTEAVRKMRSGSARTAFLGCLMDSALEWYESAGVPEVRALLRHVEELHPSVVRSLLRKTKVLDDELVIHARKCLGYQGSTGRENSFAVLERLVELEGEAGERAPSLAGVIDSCSSSLVHCRASLPLYLSLANPESILVKHADEDDLNRLFGVAFKRLIDSDNHCLPLTPCVELPYMLFAGASLARPNDGSRRPSRPIVDGIELAVQLAQSIDVEALKESTTIFDNPGERDGLLAALRTLGFSALVQGEEASATVGKEIIGIYERIDRHRQDLSRGAKNEERNKRETFPPLVHAEWVSQVLGGIADGTYDDMFGLHSIALQATRELIESRDGLSELLPALWQAFDQGRWARRPAGFPGEKDLGDLAIRSFAKGLLWLWRSHSIDDVTEVLRRAQLVKTERLESVIPGLLKFVKRSVRAKATESAEAIVGLVEDLAPGLHYDADAASAARKYAERPTEDPQYGIRLFMATQAMGTLAVKDLVERAVRDGGEVAVRQWGASLGRLQQDLGLVIRHHLSALCRDRSPLEVAPFFGRLVGYLDESQKAMQALMAYADWQDRRDAYRNFLTMGKQFYANMAAMVNKASGPPQAEAHGTTETDEGGVEGEEEGEADEDYRPAAGRLRTHDPTQPGSEVAETVAKRFDDLLRTVLRMDGDVMTILGKAVTALPAGRTCDRKEGPLLANAVEGLRAALKKAVRRRAVAANILDDAPPLRVQIIKDLGEAPRGKKKKESQA
jgi:hypothetical protein